MCVHDGSEEIIGICRIQIKKEILEVVLLKSFQDKTNAEDKSIGFDYQYYYFLYQLLALEEGQNIGIEVKDDVHIDLDDGKQVLLQLKHSIQTNASGKIVNLTERDSDLWKTLYNWVNIINDPLDGRAKREQQLDFIEKTTFILVSNKASNSSNLLLKKIADFKLKVISISDLKQYLKDLQSTTADKEINSYIETLKIQTLPWLTNFFSKLEFQLDQDDLILKIKSRIKSKQVKESKIEDVFNAIDSNLRQRNYINTKLKLKNVISFEDFYRDYHVYFDKGRNDKLPINKNPVEFDKPLEEQLFIKQLIDILAIDSTAKSEMLKLASYMLQINNHLREWLNRGLIVQEQLDEFNKDCIAKWQNSHDEVHREIKLDLKMFGTAPSERNIILTGLKCLDEVRKNELIFEETVLGTELSNGQFYLLSNEPYIGWRIDWEEKYNNDLAKKSL
ncbi:hypothetical protein SAMN05444162_3031 [Paenibacillaceae bacterium GAS479]|nr:hypothetical protein SAMN05444162_3031 [Paenibacillaceae bacterium GAS479]